MRMSPIAGGLGGVSLIALLCVALSASRSPSNAKEGNGAEPSFPSPSLSSSESALLVDAISQPHEESMSEETGGPEPHPMIPPEVPDTPHEPATPAFSTEFQEQLHRAAQAGGGGPEEACLEWGRILPIAFREEASEAEQSLALFNVAGACSRGENRGANDLRLASEALHRYRSLDTASEDAVRKLEDTNPGQKEERSFILFVDDHVTGTKVSLDGVAACMEPCALAIPVDGEAHLLEFESGREKIGLTWRPSSPDGEPPVLPIFP